MPAGDKLKPKSTREHLLSIYGYITGIKKDMKHRQDLLGGIGYCWGSITSVARESYRQGSFLKKFIFPANVILFLCSFTQCSKKLGKTII